MAKTLNRVGEVHENNDGLKMIIIQYQNSKTVTVQFESGYIKTTNMSTILRGQIKDNIVADAKRQDHMESLRIRREMKIEKQHKQEQEKMDKAEKNKIEQLQREDQKVFDIWDKGLSKLKLQFTKTVHNVGFHGVYDGEVSNDIHYNLWRGILARCYSIRKHDSRSNSYLYASVDERWHCFVVFIEDIKLLHGYDRWLDGEDMQLDKDLFGNGIYSRETCIFLSSSENNKAQGNDYRLMLYEKYKCHKLAPISLSKILPLNKFLST